MNLTPDFFSYYPHLENHVYKNWSEDTKFCHAHNSKLGVRMILIRRNNKLALYYCKNENDNAVIPEVDEHDTLKGYYRVCENYHNSIQTFVENLGRGDIVRTHEAVYDDRIDDEKLLVFLNSYFNK